MHLRTASTSARLLGIAASLWMTAAPALAEPGYYVVTAYDNEGQRTVDFRYWSVKLPDSAALKWPEIGLGYGVNSRWYTELYASYIGSADMATKLSTVNWQNEVLLTQGQYPVDVALHALLTYDALSYEGDGLEFGPVLQTDIGRTQLNANVFLERHFGAVAHEPTQMKYQWQLKRRWKPALQFGLQGFGELGEWNHWSARDQQSHRAGPAIFGSVPVGNGQALIYQAAYLIGSVYGVHANMFSMRVQYAY